MTLLLCLAQEDREWALRKGLEEINKEIEAASRSGVACWFPMGTRNERIVRLAAKEAQLLNSRCAQTLSATLLTSEHGPFAHRHPANESTMHMAAKVARC